MRIEEVKTFEQLELYLREFANFGGDPVPYDFNGARQLFLAVLDNLADNHLDADLDDLDRPVLTEHQLGFLRKLEDLG